VLFHTSKLVRAQRGASARALLAHLNTLPALQQLAELSGVHAARYTAMDVSMLSNALVHLGLRCDTFWHALLAHPTTLRDSPREAANALWALSAYQRGDAGADAALPAVAAQLATALVAAIEPHAAGLGVPEISGALKACSTLLPSLPPLLLSAAAAHLRGGGASAWFLATVYRACAVRRDRSIAEDLRTAAAAVRADGTTVTSAVNILWAHLTLNDAGDEVDLPPSAAALFDLTAELLEASLDARDAPPHELLLQAAHVLKCHVEFRVPLRAALVSRVLDLASRRGTLDAAAPTYAAALLFALSSLHVDALCALPAALESLLSRAHALDQYTGSTLLWAVAAQLAFGKARRADPLRSLTPADRERLSALYAAVMARAEAWVGGVGAEGAAAGEVAAQTGGGDSNEARACAHMVRLGVGRAGVGVKGSGAA